MKLNKGQPTSENATASALDSTSTANTPTIASTPVPKKLTPGFAISSGGGVYSGPQMIVISTIGNTEGSGSTVNSVQSTPDFVIIHGTSGSLFQSH